MPTSPARTMTCRGHWTRPPSRSTPTSHRPNESFRATGEAHAAQRGVPVALARGHGVVLPLPAGGDGVPLLHPLRRVHLAAVDGAAELDVRRPRLSVLLARHAQHPVAGARDRDAADAVRTR